MAHSYKRVTICTELFTIAVWMDVPNSHLPLGSLRGWLLATEEGRQKSTIKSGLVSNRHGVWMHYLNAEVGGMAHSGAPSGKSQLTDSDELGSCSCLMVGPRYSRVCYDTSNDICGMSMEETMWSVVVGEAIGR